MRVRRECTSTEDYDHFIQPLLQAYRERGYPQKDLKDTYCQVRTLNRSTLLQNKNKDKDSNVLVCVLPYNTKDLPARKTILLYWHILQNLQTVGHTCIFKDRPIFGYYRPKNFKNLLCRANISYPPNKPAIEGTELALFSDLCDRLNCKDCTSICNRQHFCSRQTGIKYRKNHTLKFYWLRNRQRDISHHMHLWIPICGWNK